MRGFHGRVGAVVSLTATLVLSLAGTATADHADSGWGDGGVVRAPLDVDSMSAYNSGVQAGKLLVAGGDPLSPHDPVLVRLASDGSKDKTFSTGYLASAFSGPVTDVEALSSGGAAIAVDGKLAVLKADGSLDTSFSGDGIYSIADNATYANQNITQVELESGGDLLAGGTARKLSCPCSPPFLTRVQADGSGPDLRFGGNGDGLFYRPEIYGNNSPAPVYDEQEMTKLSLAGDGEINGTGAIGFLTEVRDANDNDLVTYDRTNSAGGFWGEQSYAADAKRSSSIGAYGDEGFAFAAGSPFNGPAFITQTGVTGGFINVFSDFNFVAPGSDPSVLGSAPDGQVVDLVTVQDILAPAPFEHVGLSRYDATGSLVGRKLLPDDLGLLDSLDVLEATNSGEYVADKQGRVDHLLRDDAIVRPPIVTFSGTAPESTIGPDGLRETFGSDQPNTLYRCTIDNPFKPQDGTDCGTGASPDGLTPGRHCLYARAYLDSPQGLVYGPQRELCVTVKDPGSTQTQPIVLSATQPGTTQGMVDRGIRVHASCAGPCTVELHVRVSGRFARKLGLKSAVVAHDSAEIANANDRVTLIGRISQHLANRIARKTDHPRFSFTVTGAQASAKSHRLRAATFHTH